MFNKRFVQLMAGAVIGNWVSEMFLLKASPDAPGFVLVNDGLGLDDLTRAAAIAFSALTIQRMF